MVKLSSEELKAVKVYSGDRHREINTCLRGEEPCAAATLALVKAIDAAISKARLPHERILFRGVGVAAASRIRASGLAVGSSLIDDAFMSTSTSPSTAGMFAHFPPGGLMLKIHAPSGMRALDVGPYSLYPDEGEFLLPRGTELRILGYDPAKSELECEVIVDG